jgi:hypothetical protein
MLKMKRFFLIYLFIFSGSIVFCQVEKQLLPSDLKQQTIVTEPATLRKGYFRTGIALSYGVVDKYYNDSAEKVYFLESAWSSSYSYLFIFQYGITDRFMVDLSTQISRSRMQNNSQLIWPENNVNTSYSFNLEGKGIGDSYLLLKYQIIPEKENKISLTGALDVTFPTGKKNPTNVESATMYDLPTGNGYFVTGIGLTARKIRYPYSYKAYSYYYHKFPGSRLINATDTEETEFKDGDRIDLGGSFDILLNDWIALTNELNFYYRAKCETYYTTTEITDPAWAFNYETRLVFQVKKFRIGEGVRVPLKGKNISADPLYVLLLQYIF